jgi:hypothetical protein
MNLMTDLSSTVGFAVIVVLYTVIGLLATTGSAVLSQKVFHGRSEQIFYGALLILIAGFYLAFAAYFGSNASWRTELLAVVSFSLLGILGTRYAPVLIVAYVLHGIWDILHELGAHGGWSILEPGRLTAIPLAYGVFCLTFDIAIAAYFVRRKGAWQYAPRARG